MKHCPSRWRNFYPRPPRGGRRSPAAGVRRAARFLSTPSARRATPTATPSTTASRYFYPRPPRGGRPPRCRWFSWVRGISIHALREEGDNKPKTDATRVLPFLSTPSARRATSLVNSNLDLFLFLSTPSARRATKMSNTGLTIEQISIHALREEGDSSYRTGCSGNTDFYPRPPRGGRPTRAAATGSTEPISIHALREEGDMYSAADIITLYSISIHALREEGDATAKELDAGGEISIHALREEGDPGSFQTLKNGHQFLSTPSARRATALPCGRR